MDLMVPTQLACNVQRLVTGTKTLFSKQTLEESTCINASED